MDYLSTDRAKTIRHFPKNMAPWARAMIFLAARYPSPKSPPIEKPSNINCGRIASYAWTMDYHKVLIQKMQSLINTSEKIIGHDLFCSCHTDNFPILERSLAVSSGLGWIGRNSSLINPELGSNFWISEIFLDLHLESDNQYPIQDLCGPCKRCINACPTNCILHDRTIDSRRCIAYLTIENRGIIPRAYRHSIGEWVFGCDICQIICPWNDKAGCYPGFPDIPSRADIPFPNLSIELTFTPQMFKEKYKYSPVIRARYMGFMRNLIVSAGCQKDEASLPALIKMLSKETDPLLRGHAVWAIGQIPSVSVNNILNKLRHQENDPFILDEIDSVLDGIP
jgi:epoxyqueuosine reductase